MKIIKYILIIVVVGVGIFLLARTKPKVEPAPVVVEDNKPVELCFGMFGTVNAQGYADKYTLQMSLDNKNGAVSGDLNFVPAEKDKKTGKFEGTVTPVDKVMMARTVNATWHTSGEGVNADEPLKIIFGEGTASIEGFGLELTDIACSDPRI